VPVDGWEWPALPRFRWRGSGPKPLAQRLIMFAYHESGWREDVHAGQSAFDRSEDTSKGDQGESWCLTQQRMGKSPMARRRYPEDRYQARELVGVDPESTRRCLIVGADVIASAAERCRRQGDPSMACLVSQYAGGSLPTSAPAVKRRVATLNKVDALWRAEEKRIKGST
jgi:hypothetical protein